MTSSQIDVPTTTTASLATDEIADRHYQGTKVFGGGAGIANELHIDENGASRSLPFRQFYALDGGAGGELPLNAGGYSPGECVTGGVTQPETPPGMYQIASLKVLTTQGSPLPAGFQIAFIAFDSENPPTWQTDGATFSISLTGGYGYEALAAEVVGGFTEYLPPLLITDDHPIMHVLPGFDSVRIIPFTTDLIASFGAGELLIVIGKLERIGPVVVGA